MNKKLLMVPTAAVAAALAAGSIAYACTLVQGTTTVKFGTDTVACTSDTIPQSGTGNCDINLGTSRKMIATADNAATGHSYYLWFLNNAARDQDGMGICMDDVDAKHVAKKSASNSDGTGTGAAVTPDANGDIGETTRYIPSTISHGVLWSEQNLTHSGVHNATASVCWMDEGIDYATNDVTVLVTGGLTTGS